MAGLITRADSFVALLKSPHNQKSNRKSYTTRSVCATSIHNYLTSNHEFSTSFHKFLTSSHSYSVTLGGLSHEFELALVNHEITRAKKQHTATWKTVREIDIASETTSECE